MVRLSSRYGSRHPRDVAARRMQRIMRVIKEQGCTRKELDNPTECNVKKCMREMQSTSRAGEQFKQDAKSLGENTNLDRCRRRK